MVLTLDSIALIILWRFADFSLNVLKQTAHILLTLSFIFYVMHTALCEKDAILIEKLEFFRLKSFYVKMLNDFFNFLKYLSRLLEIFTHQIITLMHVAK